jgi:hypothetical protein
MYIFIKRFEYFERIQCIAYKIINPSIECPCIHADRIFSVYINKPTKSVYIYFLRFRQGIYVRIRNFPLI